MVEVRRSRLLIPLDLVRGFLIGLAELVPGVSGGTVALVTGVYDHLISSASHVVNATSRLVKGPHRRRTAAVELRRTDWWLVVPVLAGMGLAVVTLAGVMSDFVGDHPEQARGLFFGLVAASVVVPFRMLPRARAGRSVVLDVVPFVVAAVGAFLLVGLAGGREVREPSLLVVFAAAAVAICALVVPGVSGSFFLLAVGLYTTTLDAVHDRDLGYIAVFALGAIAGLASFVQILRWLLDTHRRVTLLAMAGLMVGSLRALWPWQEDPGDPDREGTGALVGPYDPTLWPILLAVIGAVTVLILVVAEARREWTAARAISAGPPRPTGR